MAKAGLSMVLSLPPAWLRPNTAAKVPCAERSIKLSCDAAIRARLPG